MSVILRDVISNKDIVVSSREIAEITGKRHDHVLADIDKIVETNRSPKFSGDLQLTEYKDKSNRTYRMYNLKRNAILVLMMGYSIELRIRVVERLEELETANNHNITYNHFREQSCDGHNELYGVLLDYTNDDESITRKQIAISHKVRRQVGLSSDLNWNEATNEQLAERDDLLRYYNRLIKKGLANDFKQFIEIY